MQPIPHWAAVIGMVALALTAPRALAEDYPTRTVTIVAPSAPGGMYSILARLIGGKLEQLYGKSFVVENRPGATSVTGAVAVARAPADGYTLMVATSSTMATNVAMHKNLPYDPLTDFIPLVLIALSPEVLLINASLPVRSIDDLVALARATPGGLSFGSAGPGTAQHLNGEMLKATLNIELHHVPYKGIQPALNDLAGGHIALMTAPIPVALPLVQGGRARMLGVDDEGARRGHSRCALARRDRRSRLQRAVLVHAGGAGEDAAGDRRQTPRRPARGPRCRRRARGIHPAPRLDSGGLAAARPAQGLRSIRDRPAGRHREESRLDRVAVGSDRDGSS